MHSEFTAIAARQHIADLRRAADQERLVQAATAGPAAARPIATVRVTLIRRLRRRPARTHPAAR